MKRLLFTTLLALAATLSGWAQVLTLGEVTNGAGCTSGKLPARSQALSVLNKATNESVAVEMVGDELATFEWPAADVEVTAEFIDAGYWGDPEVNGGKNVMWQKFMIDDTYYKVVFTGSGKMADTSKSTTTLIRAWGNNKNVKEIVFGDGIESTGTYTFNYANGLEKVDWGTLKHIDEGAFYRPYKLGMNDTIVFPATIESIGAAAFAYGDDKVAINGVFDFSACTNLTEIGQSAFYGTSVTCILPPSIKASYKNSFSLPPYVVLPEGMTLFVNNTQMPDDGEKATVNLSLAQPFTFELKPDYYRLNLGEVTSEGSSLQFYTTMNASYQLSNELQAGMKAFHGDEDAKVYIKVTAASNAYLAKNGIRVVNDATGAPVAVTQETPAIFSFVMPNSSVTISAEFVECVLAGIQGSITWSVHEDGLWEDDGYNATAGTKKYKLIFSGTGAYAGVSSSGNLPWNQYAIAIGSVVYEEGITDAGDGSMRDLYNLYSVQFPSTMTTLGYGMFRSNFNLKYLKMPVLLSDNSDQSVFASTRDDLTVDFSECTELTTIGSEKYNGFRGTAILPATITSIQKQAFISPNNPIKIYFVAPEDRTLFLNNVQSMVEPNEKGWIELTGYNQQNAYTVEWREGYHNRLSLGELTGESGTSLELYSSYDGTNLSNPITAGNKLHDSMTGETVYVKVSYDNYRRMDDDGLVVMNKATGERIPAEVVSMANNIYSFTFPGADVTVSVNTIIGGYCGDASFNGGYDARWQITENGVDDEGNTTYKLTIKGTGAMANASYGRTGWRYTGLPVTELEIEEGITRIGSQNFYQSAFKKIKLANSILSIGTGAFYGLKALEGALVMPSSLVQLDGSAFEQSSFDLDFTPCTQFAELSDGLRYWYGARVVMPASLERITSNGAFTGAWTEGNCSYVDLSRCTKLTAITGVYWFDTCKGGEIILPSSFVGLNTPAVTYGGFCDCTSKLSIVVPEDKVLYIEDQLMDEADGKADISAYMAKTAVFDWRPAYQIKTGKMTGAAGGTMRFYLDFDGTATTNEIVRGKKLEDDMVGADIYVNCVNDDAQLFVFPEDLTITAVADGTAQAVEAEQVVEGIYRFKMPASFVTVSAHFTKGGYCGNPAVNNGRNLLWTLTDETLDFQKNALAQGDNRQMADFANGAPWQQMGATVKTISLGDAASIGDNAFSTCTAVIAVELGATPVTVGQNAFAKSTCLIVPAASYADYQASWSEYAGLLEKDKETLTMKDGQQWRTCYSRVGRLLPAGLKAYVISGIEGSQVVTGKALDYIPAAQAVLVEHSDKTAVTAEATTSGAPYAADNQTPVCQLTTSELNMLQWLDSPMQVSAAQGYTLYKDEFVMVSSGTLPAGIAFLPAQSGNAARTLSILGTEGEATAIELPTTEAGENGTWYTIDGKKLADRPTQKGLYISNGRKVVIK